MWFSSSANFWIVGNNCCRTNCLQRSVYPGTVPLFLEFKSFQYITPNVLGNVLFYTLFDFFYFFLFWSIFEAALWRKEEGEEKVWRWEKEGYPMIEGEFGRELARKGWSELRALSSSPHTGPGARQTSCVERSWGHFSPDTCVNVVVRAGSMFALLLCSRLVAYDEKGLWSDVMNPCEFNWISLCAPALRSRSASPFYHPPPQTTTCPKRTLARSRLCTWKSRLSVGACFLCCACLYWLILCIKSQRKHAGVTQCNTDKTDCQVFWRKSRTAWVIDYIWSEPSKQIQNTSLCIFQLKSYFLL